MKAAVKSIRVLRVGQRYVRDDRTFTHLCLVSRALGAECIYLEDAENDLVRTVEEVNSTWGGSFRVVLGEPWKKVMREAKEEGRTTVHLTMYGIPLQEKTEELRRPEKVLVIVGGPKVPGRVYHESDYNIAVTSQPHSEIAALSIVLHEIRAGKSLRGAWAKVDSESCLAPVARGLLKIENRI